MNIRFAQINVSLGALLWLVAGMVLGVSGQTRGSAESGPETKHPAFFLVGDSLMKTGRPGFDRGPKGYGDELIPLFDPERLHVYNEARGGRSSREYIEEGLWSKLLARMEPGDWVLVQFGHNDTRNSRNHPDRATGMGSGDEMMEVEGPDGKKRVHTYGWYLRQYVKDTAEKGVKVVIASPVPRNRWEDGKIIRGFDGYVKWSEDAARESGAYYVDLNRLSADRYDARGQAETRKMFSDGQHTNKGGAKINAEALVAGLKQLENCELDEFLIKTDEAPGP